MRSPITNTARPTRSAATPPSTQGNSYEIYSNLGQGAYFEVPGGKTYFVNVAVADTGVAIGNDLPGASRSAAARSRFHCSTRSRSPAATVSVDAPTFTGGATPVPTLTAAGGKLTGGYFTRPGDEHPLHLRRRRGGHDLRRFEQHRLPVPRTGNTEHARGRGRRHDRGQPRRRH